MKGIHMTTDHTLSLSTVTHIINAPIEKVDIADWLFNLPDAEYQRCSPDKLFMIAEEILDSISVTEHLS